MTISGISLMGLAVTACSDTNQVTDPNIILILADDMGYSDIGCFGSEIQTPNLDRLAEQGIRMTHFYNASRSCPTRASLLTGLYQHPTGLCMPCLTILQNTGANILKDGMSSGKRDTGEC